MPRTIKCNIATFARVRPLRTDSDVQDLVIDERMLSAGSPQNVIRFPKTGEEDECTKYRDELNFRFVNVFGPKSSQEDVFKHACSDVVYSVLDGYNGSILCYGQSGSGKTYTMEGNEEMMQSGVIQRVISTLYEESARRQEAFTFYVSYVQVYNEVLSDLLMPNTSAMKANFTWQSFQFTGVKYLEKAFKDIGIYRAETEDEALEILRQGRRNRVTRETAMNHASSRSHSVYTIILERRSSSSDQVVVSKLYLVDLAGSERVQKQKGTATTRAEGKQINLSLHHLEQVILSLHSQNSLSPWTYHTPYRNSMLTSLLRGAIGEQCRTVFIATLNPESEFDNESISTCRFMQRCAEVSYNVSITTKKDKEGRLRLILEENSRLVEKVDHLQSHIKQLETALYDADHEVEYYQRQIEVLERNHDSEDELACDFRECEQLVKETLLSFAQDGLESDKTSHEAEGNESPRNIDLSSGNSNDDNTDEELSNLLLQRTRASLATCILSMRQKINQALRAKNTQIDNLQHELENTRAQLQEERKSVETCEKECATDDFSIECQDKQTLAPSLGKSKHIYKSPDAEMVHPITLEDLQHSDYDTSLPSPTKSTIFPDTRKLEDDPVEAQLNMLRNGSIFVKHSRWGRPHARFIWCTSGLSYLNCRALSEQKIREAISIRSIERVSMDNNDVGTLGSRRDIALTFTIHHGGNRTMTLEVADSEDNRLKECKRVQWMLALKTLINTTKLENVN